MNSIVFIDTEIDPKSKRILDIGGLKSDGTTYHGTRSNDFTEFLKGTDFICGHNILKHDIKYIKAMVTDAGIPSANVIDTLHLSALLFPKQPYHALLKDDKLQTDELNNPLNDALKAKDLFYDEVLQFQEADESWKTILYNLLHDQDEFQAFFRFIDYEEVFINLKELIQNLFDSEICKSTELEKIIEENPVELAYCLSLIRANHRYSITPPWVLRNYPEVERIFYFLRNKPCLSGCSYCNQSLDVQLGLKEFFGFNAFRTFGGEALQENAAKAAISGKSLLAVFPTGGGKSITFQVPALMSGKSVKGLTVVISPLQSLMKDQVDNLENANVTNAVTINGLLDPIERAKSFERVENGSAAMLYISPESLRSKSIERLLLGRKVVRFVIDEAHCFSSWGQDFRVDYLYIGDFIQSLQEKKNLSEPIPVSCFTATAKQKVIEDIQAYFKEKLALDLELFRSKTARTNLHYKVSEQKDEAEKYQSLRNLIDQKNCPTIVYVSRTKRAYGLAERLTLDGYEAKPYHGKMDKQEKSKNQDAFINGDVQIIVATSAFGMGVDKKDVGAVIHYEISDSLENYIQEAGRAGRDENMTADCYVLFNEEDLSKHFILLNQTKLSIKEIQQVWKAIKYITKFRATASQSALEIARRAGWDDNILQIETRVTTAIAALENAGYLKRGQNMPRIFANSILAKNAQEAIDKINASKQFEEKQKVQGIRIIKKLLSSKSRKQNTEDVAESRVDYISDHLGIVKEEVINIITLLREEGILADAKDLTAFIKVGEQKNKSLKMVELFGRIEQFLLTVFTEEEQTIHLKELNEQAEEAGCTGVNPQRLKLIINFWAIKNWIKRQSETSTKDRLVVLSTESKDSLSEKLKKRQELARFIIELLFERAISMKLEEDKKEKLVEFSVLELKEAYEQQMAMFKMEISLADVEDALFYLSRIEAIKIEGGFLVVYNKLTIERLEENTKRNYKLEDYKQLSQFYDNKVQQIHIVGEYAKRMINDYEGALQFVEDYFQLNYSSFLNKHFNVDRQKEIKQNITPAKFKQLFGELSPAQLNIIKDNKTQYMVVAAGPGSGKTRVLVHKLASLLLMEDVKSDQLLMLTFSRAAATEFKQRLLQLVGNVANFIEIKTFHSYCFDLLGRVGNIEKSENIIQITVEKIQSGEVEINRITKTVLVIDEAQDMDADEFNLLTSLLEQNEELRVIAVGDDDQNIYEFRGASSKYLEQFIEEQQALKHELVENYRSKSNLVDFSNQFVQKITHRLKSTPIVAVQQEPGSIKIVQYQSQQFMMPLLEAICTTDRTGSTCVLTRNNDEASQLTALLLKRGIPAQLIQSNEGFRLSNLFEVRWFVNQLDLTEDTAIISKQRWKEAKRAVKEHFQGTKNLPICLNLIQSFEITQPDRKYQSDLKVFIRESKLEDFYTQTGDMVSVSTIHKAKGKEFDQVFLLLQNYNATTDADKRLLYVAMTRAKEQLHIHLNGSYLDGIQTENLERKSDDQIYSVSQETAMHCSLKDVWLDYFIKRQYAIQQLKSGDELQIGQNELLNQKGISIVKFSRHAQEKVAKLTAKGYVLESAQVNFMLYWQKERSEEETIVVLPELRFEREINKIE